MLPKYSNQHAQGTGPRDCRRVENDCPYWAASPCETDCAVPKPKPESAPTSGWQRRSKDSWADHYPSLAGSTERKPSADRHVYRVSRPIVAALYSFAFGS